MHALRERIHGTLHSAKEETEAKAGKLKGDVKEILHKGHKGITNLVESVHESVHGVNESVHESVHSHSNKYDGESSDLLETSIPVAEEKTKTSIPVVEQKMEISIPVVEEKSNDTVKPAGSESTSETSVPKTEQCGNKFGEFFANIFEKCCSPVSKKKD